MATPLTFNIEEDELEIFLQDVNEHLQAMETIFKHVQRDIFRKFLRQCETAGSIAELIDEADELA